MKINARGLALLKEIGELSEGGFSYRIGSATYSDIHRVKESYTVFAREALTHGRSFGHEHDCWDEYCLRATGVPAFQGDDGLFVVVKVGRNGASFMQKDGGFGSLATAWKCAAGSGFGMKSRQGRLLRFYVAKMRYGFAREHQQRVPSLACA